MRFALLVAVSGCFYASSPPPPQPHRVAYRVEDPAAAPADPMIIAEAPAPAAVRDDALVLLGRERATFGAQGHTHARICVQDQARIDVDGSTEIVLAGNQTTVIGGRGIGPKSTGRAVIKIVAADAPEIFVLFDNEHAPIEAVFDAPRSKVHIGITGKTGLQLGGKIGTSVMNAGWGLPASFPACDATIDREPPPSFPPSVDRPENCIGSYKSSNYRRPHGGARELHVVGVYEGDRHDGGTVVVQVAARPVPVVLALGAYQPTTFRLDLAPGARIAAVYTFGYHQPHVRGAPPDAKLEPVPVRSYAYGWEPGANTGGGGYAQVIAALRKATGLVESSFQGCYAGKVFEIR